jgi:ABC-type branched-subunit amino acid transport system permease subunit
MVGYLISLAISIATYALFSLGLNLQWGFTGLINFGHIAFMTLGAYTTVLLSVKGVPLIIAALAGGLLAAFLGLLIGLSTLRLREDYLAIVTIGVSEVVRLIATNEEKLTYGTRGVVGFPLPLNDGDLNVVLKVGMSGILTAIVGISVWKLWQWMSQLPQGNHLKSRNRKVLLFAGYVFCLAFLTLSLWLGDRSPCLRNGATLLRTRKPPSANKKTTLGYPSDSSLLNPCLWDYWDGLLG